MHAQHSPEAIDEQFQEEFAKKRKRQITIALFIIPSLIIAVLIRHELIEVPIDEQTFGTFFLALVVLAIGYTYFNWRCPKCNRFFGKEIAIVHCPECGTKLGASL